MNAIQKRRLTYVIFFTLVLALAAALILFALKKNMNVFLTPSQLTQQHASTNYHFRLGGLVKRGSFQRETNSMNAQFIVTDLKKELQVHYAGILPDLFREGSGVVAEGYLNAQGLFIATQVLAKHDENYMPKNVDQVLKENAK